MIDIRSVHKAAISIAEAFGCSVGELQDSGFTIRSFVVLRAHAMAKLLVNTVRSEGFVLNEVEEFLNGGLLVASRDHTTTLALHVPIDINLTSHASLPLGSGIEIARVISADELRGMEPDRERTFVQRAMAEVSILATSLYSHTPSLQDLAPLTPREVEIIAAVANGHQSAEISRLLGISAKTVARHRENIRSKLGFSSSAELLKFAVRRGLICI